MCYLRSCLKEDFFEFGKKIQSKHILLTQPKDLDFEYHCLSHYNKIVKGLSMAAEKISTLESDL